MAWLGNNTHNKELFSNTDANIDIPLDDISAWNLYPKYNWIYSTSRLLDMQNIKWTLFPDKDMSYALPEFKVCENSSSVYIRPLEGDFLTTDVAILKGEIKWAAHHITENNTKTVLEELRGDVELRVSAMATLHLQKFAGVISVDTIGHDIISARLRMTTEVINQYPADWLKKVVRIYNRRPWGK